MWPQTLSGHAWRTRSVDNVVQEVKNALSYFPQMKEIFFDDDTFNIRKDRVIELSQKFKPLKFQWSCTARCHSKYEELKAMADGGARLFIVGFESGDAQILKNIKKGATTDMAREFMKNCRKVGIKVHGDFIIGLPGETKDTINKTIDFAKELDCETIQVSLAHAMPEPSCTIRCPRKVSARGSSGRPGRAPVAAHRIPASLQGGHDGGRYALLRRILFPPQGRLADREGSVVGQPRAQTALSRSHGLPAPARRTPEVGAARRRRAQDNGPGGRNLIGQRQRLRCSGGWCSIYALPV